MWPLLSLLTLASVASFATPAPVALPAEIRATLNQEYPGWKFSPVSASVQKEFVQHVVGHPPSLVWADFDRDGAKDYVVQIALTEPGSEEQIVIAFMHRGSGYEEKVLESRGLNPSIYLWIRKLKDTSVGTQATLRDALIIMGTETGDTTYEYNGDKFEEVVDNHS